MMGWETSIDPENALQWLEERGYRYAIREQGIVECLLTAPGERFLGRGVDREEAVLDALGQAFPSAAARSLLISAVSAAPVEAPAPLAEVPPEQPVEPSEPEEPSAAPEEPPASPAVVAAEEPPPLRRVGDVAPAPRPERKPAAPTMSVDEALAEVALLVEAIDSEQAEVALMAPERQRLVMLAWVCRARASEEATEDAPVVVDRVAGVARRLGVLSKIWWPGTVLALRRDATPSDVGREIGLNVDARPRTWVQAAEVVEAHLARLEEKDEAENKDEYGWADEAALEPAPIKPDAQLVQLRRQIERVAGRVDEPPPTVVLPTLKNPSPDEHRQYSEWIRLLRWLRGCVSDFATWGAVAGRLRWIAAHATRRDDRRLEDLLDPSFAPRRSWATELGQDPEAKRKKHEKRRLLQGRPRPGAAPDRAALVAWIRSAFEVLEDTRIAALLMGFAPVVLALDVADLPGAERRERRRLRKVQSLLSEIDPSAAERMAAEDAADVEAPEPEADDGALDDWDDPAERLLELVKRRTVGRTALFISNRKDPLLEQTLRDTFGFSELAWCEGSPRRVQTMSERVAAGTYDFVLSATGFQSHSVDAHMVRACRRAQAFYVRVHRGRRLACILALAREMGLGEDEDAPARSAAAG